MSKEKVLANILWPNVLRSMRDEVLEVVKEDILQSYKEFDSNRKRYGKRHPKVLYSYHDLGICCMNWGINLREAFSSVGQACMKISLVVFEHLKTEVEAQTGARTSSERTSDPEEDFRFRLLYMEVCVWTGLCRCHSYLGNTQHAESFAIRAFVCGLKHLDEIGSNAGLCDALEELARNRFEAGLFWDACYLYKQHAQLSLSRRDNSNETSRGIKWLGNTLIKLSQSSLDSKDDCRNPPLADRMTLAKSALACHRHCLAAEVGKQGCVPLVLEEYGKPVREDILHLKALQPGILAPEWRKVSLEQALAAIGSVPQHLTPRSLAMQWHPDMVPSQEGDIGTKWASLSRSQLDNLLLQLRSDGVNAQTPRLSLEEEPLLETKATILGQRVVFPQTGSNRRIGTCISTPEDGLVVLAFGDGDEITSAAKDVEQTNLVTLFDDLCAILGPGGAVTVCEAVGIQTACESHSLPSARQLCGLSKSIFERAVSGSADDEAAMLAVVTDCAFWALGMARRDCDEDCVVSTLNLIGNVFDHTQQLQRAVVAYQEALSVLHSTWLGEIPERERATHMNFAVTYVHLEDRKAATTHFREAGMTELQIPIRIAHELCRMRVKAKQSSKASARCDVLLKSGSVVVISGLVPTVQLNGQYAILQSFDAEQGMWRVQLASSRTEMAFKAENLRVLPMPPPSDSDSDTADEDKLAKEHRSLGSSVMLPLSQDAVQLAEDGEASEHKVQLLDTNGDVLSFDLTCDHTIQMSVNGSSLTLLNSSSRANITFDGASTRVDLYSHGAFFPIAEHVHRVSCLRALFERAGIIIEPPGAALSRDSRRVNCPNRHPLKFTKVTYAGRRWQCDRCTQVFTAAEMAWRCEQCMYDLCWACFDGFDENACGLLATQFGTLTAGEGPAAKGNSHSEGVDPGEIAAVILHASQLLELKKGELLPPCFPDGWHVSAAVQHAYGSTFSKARVIMSMINKGALNWHAKEIAVPASMVKDLCAEARQLFDTFSGVSPTIADENQRLQTAVLVSSLALDCDLHAVERLRSGENEWLNQIADRALALLSSLSEGQVFVATNDSSCIRSKTLRGPEFLAWSQLAQCRILTWKARYCSQLGLYQESLQSATEASSLVEAFRATFSGREYPELPVFGGGEPSEDGFASTTETLFSLEVRCGNVLAESYRRCGDVPSAIAILQDLVDRLERCEQKSEKDLLDLRIVVGNLGTQHYHNCEYVLAAKYFKKALDLAKNNPSSAIDDHSWAVSYGNYANALKMLGFYGEAKNSYEKAIFLLKQIGTAAANTSLMRFSTALATMGEQQGLQQDPTACLSLLRDTYSASLHSDEVQLRPYIAVTYATQLRRVGDLETACTVLEEGLQVCEQMQASLLDNDELRLSIFETQTLMYHQIQKVLMLQDKPAEALEAADRGKGRALASLMAQKPGDDSHSDLSWPEMQQFVQRERCHVVVFSILEADPDMKEDAELMSWVVSPLGNLTHNTTTLRHCADLKSMVDQTRSPSTDTASSLLRGKLSVQRHTEGGELRTMFDLLIKPLLQSLAGAREVLLIPHRDLFMIPWAALVDEHGSYLAEYYSLRLCPSFLVATAVQEAAFHSSSQKDHKATFVGNPWPIPDGLQVKPLQFAAAEASILAENVSGHWETVGVLTEHEATKERVADSMQGATWVHFSCHGLLHEKALVLSAAQTADALLTTKEVQGNVLGLERGAVVVLGACNSGCGDVTGEGVLGLSRSFLAAGATAVLVSLWSVDDKWTKTFMVLMYNRLLEGMSVPNAMRMTMLSMARRTLVEGRRAGAACLHSLASADRAEEVALLSLLFQQPSDDAALGLNVEFSASGMETAAVWGWTGKAAAKISTAASSTLRAVLGCVDCRHESGRLCQHTKCAEQRKPQGGLLMLLHNERTAEARTLSEGANSVTSVSLPRAIALEESILQVQERLAALQSDGDIGAESALKPRLWAPFVLVGSAADMPLTRRRQQSEAACVAKILS